MRTLSGFDFGGTVFYRFLGMVASFVVGLLLVAVLTQRFGAGEYAAFALMASFLNLLPFADLGLGASIVNAAADSRRGAVTESQSALHIGRARLLLVGVAGVIVLASMLVLFLHAWPIILGSVQERGIEWAATTTFVCVGLSVPLGIGSRLLQAEGRMRLAMQLALVGPIAQLIGCGALLVLGAPAVTYAFLPGIAYLIVNLATYITAIRRLGFPLASLGMAMKNWRLDSIPLAAAAAPFLIISTSLAVGFQSHRIILALFGTPTELAQYSLVAQFAGPLLALITVSAQNLWSKYRTEIDGGKLSEKSFQRNILFFAAVGLVSSLLLNVGLSLISAPLTGGAISVDPLLLVSAGLYIAVVATHQPSAMLLNTPQGLWIQAALVLSAAVVAVGAMIWTVPAFGAAGPYLSFAVSMLLLQVVPTMYIAVRKVRNSWRRDEAS